MAGGNSRAIDEYINVFELFSRLAGEIFERSALRDVHGHRCCPAIAHYAFRNSVCRFEVPVGYNDLRAGLDEAPRDRFAEPTAPACYHGNLASQTEQPSNNLGGYIGFARHSLFLE
jgi:hypothetical protein